MEKWKAAAVGTVGGALLGAGAYLVYDRVRNGYWPWEDLWEDDGEDEETLGDSELAHKPDIFSYIATSDEESGLPPFKPAEADSVEELLVEARVVPRVISQEEYMDLETSNQRVACWFAEDEILAGEDERLDELNPADIHGGIGDEALEELKSGSVSGLFVLCGDGETGLEIVVSHGNYLEEYESLQAAEAEVIISDEGYSEEPDMPKKPVRRRR